jgi:hypothetical protein
LSIPDCDGLNLFSIVAAQMYSRRILKVYLRVGQMITTAESWGSGL